MKTAHNKCIMKSNSSVKNRHKLELSNIQKAVIVVERNGENTSVVGHTGHKDMKIIQDEYMEL